jgi:hypothetical protein
MDNLLIMKLEGLCRLYKMKIPKMSKLNKCPMISTRNSCCIYTRSFPSFVLDVYFGVVKSTIIRQKTGPAEKAAGHHNQFAQQYLLS